jgi:hypothetical protein
LNNMKNTKMSIIKKLAAIAAVVVISGILFISNAFLGNPISASSADKVIKQYVETTYPLLGLKVERAHHNFKLGEYMSMAQSENSIDTKFAIYSSGGKILRDTYGSVLNMFNTRQRLSREYSSLVKTLVSRELGFENNTTIVRYYDDSTDILKLDMEFDKSLPIDAEVTIRFELTDNSTESIARVLTDAHKVFVNNNCNFNKYGVYAENDKGYVMVHRVTVADIEGGELTNLLEKARNSDSISGINCVVKSYNK